MKNMTLLAQNGVFEIKKIHFRILRIKCMRYDGMRGRAGSWSFHAGFLAWKRLRSFRKIHAILALF